MLTDFLDSQISFFYAIYMDFNKTPWHKILFIWIEIIFAANILLLDIWITKLLFFNNHAILFQQTAQQTKPPLSPTPEALVTPTPTPPALVQPITTVVNPSVKEYFIPLGTGQTNATAWTNIAGAQAYVDTANYPSIKSVIFEAGASVPTVNQSVSVRLFNVTDGHPVWFSQLDFSGQQPEFKTSQQIQLDSGNKLYQVQMQTQLGSQANLDSSRIHITLQ